MNSIWKDINFRLLFLVFLGFWAQKPKKTRKSHRKLKLMSFRLFCTISVWNRLEMSCVRFKRNPNSETEIIPWSKFFKWTIYFLVLQCSNNRQNVSETRLNASPNMLEPWQVKNLPLTYFWNYILFYKVIIWLIISAYFFTYYVLTLL